MCRPMAPGMNPPLLPLWAVFAITVGVVLVSILAGHAIGAGAKRRGEPPEGPIGSAVGAMMGLLAFMLAFTFGIASSRFDSRKQLLLDDVTTLMTAVRRTDLLPEPQRSQSRALLKRMVDRQVETLGDMGKLSQALEDRQAIEDSLWAVATPLVRTQLNSPAGSLYVQSLNALEEIQTKRVGVALQFRIPSNVWFGLLLVTVFAMSGVGFLFGIAGRGSLIAKTGLALAFATVVLLIAQLDRVGGTEINHGPLLDLQRKLTLVP